MPKVAVIGANGQVGAELCLQLARRPGIDLVPICRNRSGSAFLRWQGIRCRHGRIADPGDATRLIGDCDLIVNSALATGSPAEIRRTEDRIVANLVGFSPAGATIIHFSTQSVYGDPAPGRWVRWRNPYGRAKLATERCVRRSASRRGKPVFILRLGHVCGALQEISQTIRRHILEEDVVLPERDCSSNVVYVAAIVGAIEDVAAGRVPPGIYDLMNSPRWSWREVHEYEAAALGRELRVRIGAVARRPRSGVVAPLRNWLGALAANQGLRELAAKAFARLPTALNARAMAWWYVRRAGAEIAALRIAETAPEHLSWVENGERFFPSSRTTLELLRSMPPPAEMPNPAWAWPEDLPDAESSTRQSMEACSSPY